jgi:hypothetical protein
MSNIVKLPDRVESVFFDLEAEIRELHRMAALTVMALENKDDALTAFGVYEVRIRAKVLEEQFDELFAGKGPPA